MTAGAPGMSVRAEKTLLFRAYVCVFCPVVRP